MSAAPEVLVDAHDRVLVITLNRPAQKNAMTLAAAHLVAEAVGRLDDSPELSVAVLTGAGGAFCAGMDLKRFALGERPALPGRGFGGLVEAPPEKPIIAAVEGWALGGGCELALACDMVVAARGARFGLPEVRRGLVARGGGMIRLPQRLPRSVAMELLLTGDPIDAERAERLGLVNRVVPEGQALEAAMRLAGRVAENAPLAVRCAKAVASAAPGWPQDEVWRRQAPLSDAVFASQDAQEGARAFVEHREPRWTGR
ncbi:crotonase/enoyl-CoA hydratase family protein [Streptomyces sp. NPDC004270]